ncbi:hypothetical protein KOW79_001020 [Hemibagrus wyckioides]|uniref:Uncharacterized protein n=1 Tax=Hemibagrus wyckioides TaxID=337641 RepID=A0A9D3P821_9TELE|nr:hypothetical protein KOW79_001020 [Hemibagrus wyckioides]
MNSMNFSLDQGCRDTEYHLGVERAGKAREGLLLDILPLISLFVDRPLRSKGTRLGPFTESTLILITSVTCTISFFPISPHRCSALSCTALNPPL